MQSKKILTRSVVILIMSVLVIAMTQSGGVPLKHLVVGVITNLLYGVLILLYFLRYGLIILGVFAVYRTLQERHDRQLAG